MQNMFKRSAVALAFAGLISAAPAMAQQAPVPREPEQQRAPDPAPVSGELISLDDQAKTLVIKTESGNEMKFSYTGTTEIVGADKGASGLATMSGTPVTVHYSTHGTANTAVKIEVQPKK
jgi:hypothetical protein